MNDGLKDKHREAIIRVLAKCPKLERALLIGSRAMGTYTTTSDIDIALEGVLSLTDQARLAEEIDQLTIPYKVDLIRTHTITNPDLKEHIRQYGKIWWEKTTSTLTPNLQSTTNE